MPEVSAYDVAARLRELLPGVGAKKLHKLLYYCQGHHLATFGTPLFPEAISAWDMGPVVGKLWFRERFGDAPPAAPLPEAELNTIGYVVSRYGALSGADLEHLTHSEPPWQEANERRTPQTSAKIDPEAIKAYFASVRDDDEDDMPVLDVDAVKQWLAGAADRQPRERRTDSPDELRARLTAP